MIVADTYEGKIAIGKLSRVVGSEGGLGPTPLLLSMVSIVLWLYISLIRLDGTNFSFNLFSDS